MSITRRTALGALAGAPALILPRSAAAQEAIPEIAKGPFDGTFESLKKYKIPDWFRDAKFGMWAHWGPQSAAEQGDWYARNIYIQGSPQNLYQVQNYGHPSEFGHKEFCLWWKGLAFDADHLIQLYKKAGARYFMSMGVHHDNFDLWNSKYQPRWNAVHMGPRKDIVGLWRKAAQKHGLKFAVSEHLSNSYNWLAVSHGSDKTGPKAGVLYDETTRTLFCGDLFTQTGPVTGTTDQDIVGPAAAGEDLFRYSSLSPKSAGTVRGLAELDIDALALMHGPAFLGDCRAALHGLADDYDRRVAAS